MLHSTARDDMNEPVEEKNDIEAKKREWEGLGTSQAVLLRDRLDNKQEGQVYIQSLSKKARTGRSIKRLAIFWGGAVLAALPPVLHIFLIPTVVPLLLIAGPVFAYKQYKRKKLILGGTGACPNCNKNIIIEKSDEKWPLLEYCSHCKMDIKIYPA